MTSGCFIPPLCLGLRPRPTVPLAGDEIRPGRSVGSSSRRVLPVERFGEIQTGRFLNVFFNGF